MLNCSSYKFLFMALVSYTKLNNNTLLSFYPHICILLYPNSILRVLFQSLPPNVYLVFLVKLIVTTKGTKLNKKQIGITPKFIYTKYKVQKAMLKSAVLDLQCKTSNRSTKYYKRFCLTYVQLSRLQSLGGVLLLALISLENINNQLHHEFLEEDN